MESDDCLISDDRIADIDPKDVFNVNVGKNW